MEKLFKLNILTSHKTLFKLEASSLIAPSELGYLGVLANHAPLIANLVAGKIIFKDSLGQVTVIHSLGKGFLEVLNNDVSLLLDNIYTP